VRQQDPATSAYPKPDDSSHPVSPRYAWTYPTTSDQVFIPFLCKLLNTLHIQTFKCHLFTAVPLNHTFCVCVRGIRKMSNNIHLFPTTCFRQQ